MKPLSSPIKNKWKLEFYQVSFIHHDAWRKINRNIEGLVDRTVHRISEEMYDQIRDDTGSNFVSQSGSFFFVERDITRFQNSPSFFMDWSR